MAANSLHDFPTRMKCLVDFLPIFCKLNHWMLLRYETNKIAEAQGLLLKKVLVSNNNLEEYVLDI